MPRARTSPPQRAWRMMALINTTRAAPFSFGSHPQNRPQDWSAQIPPSTVPTKLSSRAKQTTPYTMRIIARPRSGVTARVKTRPIR